jgi:hypothetical protein
MYMQYYSCIVLQHLVQPETKCSAGVVDGGSCTAADFETTGSYNVAILAGGMYLAQDYHANATISRPNVTSNAACARCMASAWSNRAAYVHCFAPLVTTVCSVNETLALYSALHAAHGYFATASSGSQLPVMNIIAVSSGNFTISVSPQCELCFAFADQYSLHVEWIECIAHNAEHEVQKLYDSRPTRRGHCNATQASAYRDFFPNVTNGLEIYPTDPWMQLVRSHSSVFIRTNSHGKAFHCGL